ncbi:type II toxin-antitoxin system death-on-curing family toxin [Floridanema evergladense]|uniref:Type II toxin-antitoxin system death-on-curing family toxin n=1 Tax=Floridaenema evergladense BLCC-F167 TaxID=3153639 RepID=A0ABV4WM25_9CYAN
MLTPKFLSFSEIEEIHTDIISSFGGSFGIRDEGLLESALAQPEATFGGEFLHSTIYEQAAAYLYHISMNHPFIDGNKRTAFAVMDTFLRVNNYYLNLTNEQAYNLVLQVVQGEISKSELANYLQQSVIYIDS